MIQKLVGISFTPTKDDTIKINSKVELVHDKENKYSNKAIAVRYGDTHLGFIGEKGNEDHERIFDQLPLEGKVDRIARLEEGEEFGKFKTGEITSISVEFEMPHNPEVEFKSLNEDLSIQFNEEIHKTSYKGETLIGGSTYKKRFMKEFDINMIAPAYANKLGLTEKDVRGIWNGGGKCSADFGTAIHQGLEHYENFKNVGQVIMDKKDKPFNPALPKHPVFRQVVEDFYKLDLSDEEGMEVVNEALVSQVELGFAGFADRVVVDREKKIAIVKDYKINVDYEQVGNSNFVGMFKDLPKNKLSEYQLQMSFYARLLELSGWTVPYIVAYTYDKTWVAHKMEVLKLDF